MHLLLISCSSKKATPSVPVPAIELYQGVFYSVLKKAFRDHPEIQKELRVIIISAKYGVIFAEDMISNYDLKMTREIAATQIDANTKKLNSIINDLTPVSMTVVMGKTYLSSVDFSQLPIPVHFIKGEIGMMLHGLKEWLYQLTGRDVHGN